MLILDNQSPADYYQNYLKLPIVSPNSWKISEFSSPVKAADGSYTTTSKTDPNKYVYIPTTNYPGNINLYGNGIISAFDLSMVAGYFGLPSPKNYMIINGISGRLTKLAIKYWGDDAEINWHIATKVMLYADNSATGITATRSASKGYPNYTFQQPFNGLDIRNRLKITFLDISSTADGGEALLGAFRFTFS